ncbi:hypothetical protein [Streptomyces sp. NBC_01483]|uniref:hypothetical protein n=1 Tax=Streptomyces sp. NBC_01483 TaxID=2903883 RepID=UPI002E3802F7|nr:hypothetical protein [Streptomyces sp. NBC_01483]
MRRWEMGLDRWFTAPEHAVLTAAAEARRLGHASAVPALLLREAAAGFMDSTARATAGKEWFPAAIGALAATEGGPAPLIAERYEPGVGEPDSYRPDDYLEQHIRRVRAHRAPPAEFWSGALGPGPPTTPTLSAGPPNSDAAMGAPRPCSRGVRGGGKGRRRLGAHGARAGRRTVR